MKKLIIPIACAFLLMFGLKWLQGPEKQLQKKTQKLIQLANVKPGESTLQLISRVSKMDKYIHFDVKLKAEYEGQIYTAKSLNEFRSLLTSYFKQKSTGSFEYQNLTVKIAKDKQQGEVSFDAFFKRNNSHISCKALLQWLKQKKWYVKEIQVFSCVKQ